MPRRRLQWCVAVLLAAHTLAGCQPTVLEPAGPRPPAAAAAVELYDKPPKTYERLGTVQTTEGLIWDARGRADRMFEALKQEAALRGANGLLLDQDLEMNPTEDDADYARVTAYYKRDSHRVRMRLKPKAAFATAIYVLEK